MGCLWRFRPLVPEHSCRLPTRKDRSGCSVIFGHAVGQKRWVPCREALATTLNNFRLPRQATIYADSSKRDSKHPAERSGDPDVALLGYFEPGAQPGPSRRGAGRARARNPGRGPREPGSSAAPGAPVTAEDPPQARQNRVWDLALLDTAGWPCS